MSDSPAAAALQSKAYDSNTEQWPRYSGFKALKSICGEIRLLRLESGAVTKGMRYSMQHESLQASFEYSAVSYCWGAPVPVDALREIYINSVAVRIRPTLYEFSETMKTHDPELSMWIDAICIDQRNVVERNGQISVMGEIFKKAQRVYVWLGLGDDETSYAMHHSGDSLPQTAYDPLMFSWCAEKLLRASYWKRRWVIQEFALARELTVVCGRSLSEWDNFTGKISDTILKYNAEARQTLKIFKDIRSPQSPGEMSLLELMERFQDARCVDQRDRAFVLRGIATDGLELTPDYDDSTADVFFRLLSILPTERVLPATKGYRWPHCFASRLLECMPVSKDDVLSSLAHGKNDRLFSVFEFTGLIKTVTDISQDAQAQHLGDDFCSFPLRLEVQLNTPTRRLFRGCGNILAGDLVCNLQTTRESPQGLFIAFRPYPTDLGVVGMIIHEPDDATTNHWALMGLCGKYITVIRDIVLRGVSKCSRNNTGPPLQLRILCHISRRMLVLLWLLHMRQADHLWSFHEEIWKKSDGCIQTRPLCGCIRDETTLELLPSFDFQKDETLWAKGMPLPWAEQEQNLPRDRTEVTESQWADGSSLVFGYRGRTGLSHSAGDGLFQFTRIFLSAEAAKIDFLDEYGLTPLWWAAVNGHDKVVKMLLDAQAVVNIGGGEFGGILYNASGRGHVTVVRILIDAGADVNARGGYYGCPLHVALATSNEEIVKMLLDAGADVKAKGGWYDNTLQAASASGHLNLVKMLLHAGADIDAEGGMYGTALNAAAATGNESGVKVLLEAGADITISGGYKYTALQAAVMGGSVQVVKMLLDAGANISIEGLYGNAKLSDSFDSQEQRMKILLDAGADVDTQGGVYCYALQAASAYGDQMVVKMLLEAGANVNARGGHFGTALQAAAGRGNKQVVKMLLNAGAEIYIRGRWGNALEAARERCHYEVLKMLLEASS